VPSLISTDLAITGDLVSDGEIQVDGTVEGDIHCRSIIIGESGAVTGAVEAEKAVIRGTVTGRVSAKDVTLDKTARITGDIVHDNLQIEAGAQFEGQVRRLGGAAPSLPAAGAPLVLDRRAASEETAGAEDRSHP